MSPVEFKKTPCRSVDFKGHGPYRWRAAPLIKPSHNQITRGDPGSGWECRPVIIGQRETQKRTQNVGIDRYAMTHDSKVFGSFGSFGSCRAPGPTASDSESQLQLPLVQSASRDICRGTLIYIYIHLSIYIYI